MMTDINGALFPLSKNPVGTVKDPMWMVSQLIFAVDLVTFMLQILILICTPRSEFSFQQM